MCGYNCLGEGERGYDVEFGGVRRVDERRRGVDVYGV